MNHRKLKIVIHFRKGFTLIELIVVFSTIAFLSTVGIVSYRSYSQSQSFESASQGFTTTIELAKSRANSQVKPPICISKQLDGYSVRIEDVNQYSLNAVCDGSFFLLQTTTLPANIQFANDSVSRTAFFAVISGGVSGGPFTMAGYNQNKCIQINSVGISEQSLGLCPTPTPIPTPTPTPAPKYVFVTSGVWTGRALGGIAGGNAKCQTLANAVPALSGKTWLAWLSDSGNHAKDLIADSPLGYARTDGVKIADNRADLIDNDNLFVPINKDEQGNTVGGSFVWTGTNGIGLKTGRDCFNWSSVTAGGSNGFTDSNTVGWTMSGDSSCDTVNLPLYCFEQ